MEDHPSPAPGNLRPLQTGPALAPCQTGEAPAEEDVAPLLGLAHGEGKEADPAAVAERLGDTPPPHAAADAGSHGYWDTGVWLHSGPPGLRGIAYTEREVCYGVMWRIHQLIDIRYI